MGRTVCKWLVIRSPCEKEVGGNVYRVCCVDKLLVGDVLYFDVDSEPEARLRRLLAREILPWKKIAYQVSRGPNVDVGRDFGILDCARLSLLCCHSLESAKEARCDA